MDERAILATRIHYHENKIHTKQSILSYYTDRQTSINPSRHTY